MSKNEWCRHYNGIGNSKACESGVEYESIKDTSVVPYRLHCIHADAMVKCPKRELRTKEDIEEAKKQIAAALTRFAAFLDGTSDVCPQCGEKVDEAEEIGRCVYARPCGCRVYQGKLPERWKK